MRANNGASDARKTLRPAILAAQKKSLLSQKEGGIMKKKSGRQLFLSVNSKPDIIVMLIITLLLALENPIMGIAGLALVFVAMLINLKTSSSNSKAISEYLYDITSDMDETISLSVIYNPLPLCIIDSSGIIMWYNAKFDELVDDLEAGKSSIYDITGIKIHEMTQEALKDKTITFKSKQARPRNFKVFASDARTNCTTGSKMLHWVETTVVDQIKEKYRDERVCIAYVNIDNYDDIISMAPDDRKSRIGAEIENEIRLWATKCQAGFLRMGKAKYALIFDFRTLENIETNKFPILDEVRSIETGGDIPASLSIGVGASGKTPAQTEEYASAALDLSLGRGGDQAVVKKGSNIEYYGGKLQTVEKRNKGKSRIVALALRQLIDQAPNIYVMGHAVPDMDSFGAALGIARMAKNRGKKANIVIDTSDAIEMPYHMAEKEGNYNFINGEYAKMTASKEDLLILVDTHKPSLSACPALTEIIEKIVVIDHHRRGEEIVQNPILLHLEPYASSASELVTEMFQYVVNEKKSIGKLEAEVLLAGITVDTKSFSVKTGVRTFDAASWLRRQGADTAEVRQFFQIDMEMSRQEAKIVSSAEILPGNIAFSVQPEACHNVSMLISMAADSLLDIRGMRASIVIGLDTNKKVRVSARSLGELNVQRIMEKLGGGGHLTMAGAQLDMPVSDAEARVKAVAAEFIEEEKQMQQAKQNAEKKSETKRLQIPSEKQE